MGPKAPAGLLTESMAVGLVPPPPPFPHSVPHSLGNPKQHSTRHCGTLALWLCPPQVDILCSAWLEGLPGVFYNSWAFRSISVLHAGTSVPVMGGALSHRQGVEVDSKPSSTPEILWFVD